MLLTAHEKSACIPKLFFPFLKETLYVILITLFNQYILSIQFSG